MSYMIRLHCTEEDLKRLEAAVGAWNGKPVTDIMGCIARAVAEIRETRSVIAEMAVGVEMVAT